MCVLTYFFALIFRPLCFEYALILSMIFFPLLFSPRLKNVNTQFFHERKPQRPIKRLQRPLSILSHIGFTKLTQKITHFFT